MKPQFSAYLKSWADELLSRANRVRQLIGDAHWLSDGHHKEYVLREFLNRYLSPQLLIGRGFVRPPDEARCCSPEIDIVIADPLCHPALFCEGGLLIAPPSSVVAHIEVKSLLNKGNLRDALANQIATKHILLQYVNEEEAPWQGILFTDAPESRTSESLVDTIQDVLTDFGSLVQAIPQAVTDRPQRLESRYLPTCLATLERFVVFFVPVDDTTVKIKAFDVTHLGMACALANLFAAITPRFSRRKTRGELEIMLEEVGTAVPVIRNLSLGKGQDDA